MQAPLCTCSTRHSRELAFASDESTSHYQYPWAVHDNMEAVRPTTSIQQRLQHLKHDLKKFENAFRARHGRVAAREEIKADATICMQTPPRMAGQEYI